MYNLYNAKFFDNQLPQDTTVIFVPKIGKVKSVRKSACAITLFYEKEPPIIAIQRSKNKSWRYIVSDLIHEMAHIRHPRAEHGKVFQNEMKRLANAGAFETIW